MFIKNLKKKKKNDPTQSSVPFFKYVPYPIKLGGYAMYTKNMKFFFTLV